MKISLNWLNALLDKPTNADEADAVLTNVGFPIDGTDLSDSDTILDVEVTSNRSDCLSHVGVARELAAATNRKLIPPDIKLPTQSDPAAASITSVTNNAPELCPAYTARVIRNVKIAPSPKWLADRITAIGLRPINNVVDVTNYVLHELGQPLHAFDLDKLDGKKIIVRHAVANEPFAAIDGSNHKLRDNMLVIADASRPVAIAGVMGGAHSEVTDATTNILLESARFDELSVRSTSRALKLASDSSYRFERGVDPQGVERASQRAAQLIFETAGGDLAEGVITVGQSPTQPHTVTMRPQRCNQLLGIELPRDVMAKHLAAIGLDPEVTADVITCTIPSFRLDLHREADLIEEVARLHGFDHLPVSPMMRIVARPPQTTVLARKAVTDLLVAHGYHETVTFSFCSAGSAAGFDRGWDLVRVDEEKKKAEPALRPSVLPALLDCRKSNQDAGNKDVRLFEVASVFGSSKGAFCEERHLALLCDAPDRSLGLRQLRGTIEEMMDRLGAVGWTIEPSEGGETPWAEPGARIVDAKGKTVGQYGVASAAVLKRFDLQTPVVIGWIGYEALVGGYPPAASSGALARFPAIERDLSVLVEEGVRWSEIEGVIRGAEPALMEGVAYVTTFRGKQIGAGKKSVTVRLTFRDPERTLEHEEVSEQVEGVVAALKGAVGAELRV